jgi:DNA-binding HxlR family transcriptional regulator
MSRRIRPSSLISSRTLHAAAAPLAQCRDDEVQDPAPTRARRLDRAVGSAALGIKRTNFVALLDSLEQRGLAERQAAAGDRRSHALHLTERGKAVMRRLRQLVDIQERRLIGRIGEDGQRQLIDLLHRLIDGRRLAAADGARKPRRPAAKPTACRQAKANRSLTSPGIG